jgi:hypothetical protein
MQSTSSPSEIIANSLENEETRQFLLHDFLAPLLQSAQDPNTPLYALLSQASTWVTQNAPTLQQRHEEFQLANARAETLLALMKKQISLADFLKLDPIEPYTLLLVAHKITAQAGAYAELGEKMSQGRKEGTFGPIAKAVAHHLKKHPNAKAGEIWKSFEKKPPKGLMIMENRHGRYVEYFENGRRKEAKYERFRNVVREQRILLIKNHGLASS